MKPAPFDYARPGSLEEALDVLAGHGDEAKVLAGGQSLVPLLNMRFARPGVLVDVNRIPGLDAIVEQDGAVRVGALVRDGPEVRVAVALTPSGSLSPPEDHGVVRARASARTKSVAAPATTCGRRGRHGNGQAGSRFICPMVRQGSGRRLRALTERYDSRCCPLGLRS